jgi:predicted dehydrogenase
MADVRLMTLDPGHFHAALVHREMAAGVDPTVHVYGPLGPDLLAHLGRVAAFNARAEKPTAWQLEVHAGPNSRERLVREKPGNVVVLSGRNRDKLGHLEAAVAAGLHVLADKPWILRAADLPRLAVLMDTASAQGVVAFDMMTERFEITSLLQRELIHDADVFGHLVSGSAEEPGVFMESVHYLLKTVAGMPNRRPAWFFDVEQQGEGLTDVGTHLVDLVAWQLFPGQALDPTGDVDVRIGRRWATVLTRSDFQRVTGETDFPAFLDNCVSGDRLSFFCNTLVEYTLHGVYVKLNVLWDYEAETGAGDTHFAVVRGSRSRIEVRQGPDQRFRPELFVVPERSAERGDVLSALRARIARLQDRYPGLGVEDVGGESLVTIPDRYRVGHEAHFGEVTRLFLSYVRDPASLPAWEKPNLLARYRVTTEGVQLAQREPELDNADPV